MSHRADVQSAAAPQPADRRPDFEDTVWVEEDPFIDRIPRWVAMTGLFVGIVGLWSFVTWLGFGISSKVALAVFIATFPIVLLTAAGHYAASENERMLFKSMGAGRLQTLVRLKLLTGRPYLFTGLKIAAVGVMAGAITGDLLGGGEGFGALIRVSASQMNTPRVFSLIISLSFLGLLLYLVVVWLQRMLVLRTKLDRASGLA